MGHAQQEKMTLGQSNPTHGSYNKDGRKLNKMRSWFKQEQRSTYRQQRASLKTDPGQQHTYQERRRMFSDVSWDTFQEADIASEGRRM